MNGVGAKYRRHQRRRIEQDRIKAKPSRGLSTLIADQSIDWFFWEIIHQEVDFWWFPIEDTEWVLDDLLDGVDGFFSAEEMEGFYEIAEDFWAPVRGKRHSERFAPESILRAIDVCRMLAAEISSSAKFKHIRSEYGREIADRIFHDRQISYCISDYLSRGAYRLRRAKGGTRKAVPTSIKNAVFARDRGKCASCQTNITLELLATAHIDHIVPLARGGSNDLLNLQLLCSDCNLRKSTNSATISSSVPRYHQPRPMRKKRS